MDKNLPLKFAFIDPDTQNIQTLRYKMAVLYMILIILM